MSSVPHAPGCAPTANEVLRSADFQWIQHHFEFERDRNSRSKDVHAAKLVKRIQIFKQLVKDECKLLEEWCPNGQLDPIVELVRDIGDEAINMVINEPNKVETLLLARWMVQNALDEGYKMTPDQYKPVYGYYNFRRIIVHKF